MRWQERYNAIYVNLFSSYYDLLPKDLRSKYIKRGFWKKIIRVVKAILYDFRNGFKKKPNSKIISGRNWIIVDAVNNLQSVNDIFTRKSENIIFFTYSLYFNKINQNLLLFDFSFRFFYVWKMLIYIILNLRRVKDRWDLFMTETGWYESARRHLKRHKPLGILFTNDQTPINRAIILAARSLNIKTGYIQHASVRDDFGELLMDYAFLDGQDTIDKYTANGNRFQTQIHLIGMPKISKYLHLRSDPKKIETIGIAYNITDDLNEIRALATILQQANFRILIRPHPKDHRLFKPMKNVIVDNPVENNAFDFLNKVDALIAGESAIHLESILINKPSYQYNFNTQSSIHDLYGFLKNNLIHEYINPEELLNEILLYNSEPKDVYRKATYYNSLVDDPQEAKAAELALDKINHLLFNPR